MNTVTQLVAIAFLVEALWETTKMVWQDGKFNIDKVGSLITGVILSVTLNINLFTAIGLETSYNIVGVLAAGILISRGGNYIHDLFEKLEIK